MTIETQVWLLEFARRLVGWQRNPDTLPDQLAGAVAERLGGACAVGLTDPHQGDVGRLAGLAGHPELSEAIRSVHAWYGIRPGEGVVGRAMSSGQPVVVDDLVLISERMGAKEQHVALIRSLGLTREAAVPLYSADGEVVGALVGFRLADAPAYVPDEIHLLQAVAELAGPALGAVARRSALERHAAKLEEENEELRAFAYGLAHDLRAPLRAIAGLAEIAFADHAATLAPELASLLDQVLERAVQAQTLTNEVVALARDTQQPLAWSPVDLAEIANGVVATLRDGDPSRTVKVHVADDLTVLGDPYLCRTIVQNLLENAWKYSAEADPAVIEVRRDGTLEGMPAFVVADNGVGFEPEYATRIFEPFRRLHPQGRFPGTGIGLASVAQAVRRHGGSVEAHGEPGRGARVRFSLPSP